MPPRRALVATLAALTLTACGGGTDAAAPAAEPTAPAGPTLVASTDVYAAVARAVGGDRVAVEALLDDPSADPHSYESTPADAAAVAGADVVVFNGAGYDSFVESLVESAGGERTVVEAAQVLGVEDAGHSDEGDPAHAGEEGAAGHGHGGANEHFWYDLDAMKQIATGIATALGSADPDGAASYTAAAAEFGTALDALIADRAAIAAAHPGARVAVTEPLPVYLLEEAGLVDATPAEFAEAVEEDTDPPAAVLAEMLALFGADPVRVLVLNSQTQTPTTDQVRAAAEAAGVAVVEMTETLPEGTIDYVTWMDAQIAALAAALDRT